MALQDTRGNWRWMTGSPIAPALLYALAPWLLPESPRWLVMRGNLDGALAVLLRVNSKPVRLPSASLLQWCAAATCLPCSGNYVCCCLDNRVGALRAPKLEEHRAPRAIR